MPATMTKEEHIKRHKKLHRALDELSADFMSKTGNLCSNSTILDLMKWSHEQTINPAVENRPCMGDSLKDFKRFKVVCPNLRANSPALCQILSGTEILDTAERLKPPHCDECTCVLEAVADHEN